jgi:hypothetical protein
MKKNILLLFCFTTIALRIFPQGICNPDGNIIIYSNYDGGDLQINIDEDVPNIRIGLCSYESMDIVITGPYVSNVVEVVYAGYDDDGTTSVSGVSSSIVDILLYPPVTLEDEDGYDYVICAYECDTDYVPGGCNTVDQLTDYFLTLFSGTFRYSYLQYEVFDEDEYYISEGGNCCFDGMGSTVAVDIAVTGITSVLGGCNMTAAEEITVTVLNNGPGSISAIPLNLSVDGMPAVTETAFISLDEGDSGSYTFSATADLSEPGLHSIDVYASLADDPVPSNDTYSTDPVTLPSPEDALPEDISGCDELTLDAENTGATYTWNTGASTQQIVVTESGTYSVTTNLAGCSITETIDVTVNYSPIASFTYTDVGLTLTFTNTSTDADSYAWDFGDGSTSTLSDPAYTYTAAGEYTITLTVTNACGTDVYTTLVQVSTAILETAHVSSFNIYPNPASEHVIVDVVLTETLPVSLVLIDVLGAKLYNFDAGMIQYVKKAIETHVFSAGMYMLEVWAADVSLSRKLLIIQ